eukprot:maker-scaffold1297_size49794-snap-gene-0.8 protein:Tk03837 transcript:maker-scaffold1297_size49794-snap-gene-0.8-mRNA-1 annotation:"PREDICTED: mucin-16-like"
MADWDEEVTVDLFFLATWTDHPVSGPKLRDAPNDIPKPLPLSCFFATSLNVTQNVSLIISKRCRDHTWMKTVSSGSKKQIHVDNQRCGVRDALNESLATSSDLCTSAQGEGAIVSFKHKIRISNFNFTKDLGDLRKSTFKGRKRRIELDWTDIFLNPENPFVEWGFERVSVLSFEPGPSQNGLFVNAIVQFGPEAVGKNATEDYKTAWEALGVTDLGKFTLDQAFELIAEQDTCPPLSMMEKWVPSEIWSASNVTGNERIPMGQTVDFQCPLNKKLSFDNDTFVWNDDKYSVLCNPFLKYAGDLAPQSFWGPPFSYPDESTRMPWGWSLRTGDEDEFEEVSQHRAEVGGVADPPAEHQEREEEGQPPNPVRGPAVLG